MRCSAGRPRWRAWPRISSTISSPVAKKRSTSQPPRCVPGHERTAQNGSTRPQSSQAARYPSRSITPTYRGRPTAKTRGMDVAGIRERYRRIQAEAGPDVTVVAATKYVPVADMAALAEAGVDVVGENRAQDLERKHAEYGDAFRWHFIGHLQSNKVKVVNRICELVHSLDSESAARRLEVPALVEVNLAGEASKSGVAPEELPRFLERYGDVRGLMTMPPETADPEASRPYFRRLAELAREHELADLSMGTSQDYAVAAEEGATLLRVGSILYAE